MTKLANMVEKISGSVTEGYQKIEDGVVGGLGAIAMGCGMSLMKTNPFCIIVEKYDETYSNACLTKN